MKKMKHEKRIESEDIAPKTEEPPHTLQYTGDEGVEDEEKEDEEGVAEDEIYE